MFWVSLRFRLLIGGCAGLVFCWWFWCSVICGLRLCGSVCLVAVVCISWYCGLVVCWLFGVCAGLGFRLCCFGVGSTVVGGMVSVVVFVGGFRIELLGVAYVWCYVLKFLMLGW